MDFVCLRWNTKDDVDHSAIAEEEQEKGTEMNVDQWFRVEPFRAIKCVLHVVRGNNENNSLNRALP